MMSVTSTGRVNRSGDTNLKFSDGGYYGSKKWKRCYGGACGGVWWSAFGEIMESGACFVQVRMAGIWLQKCSLLVNFDEPYGQLVSLILCKEYKARSSSCSFLLTSVNSSLRSEHSAQQFFSNALNLYSFFRRRHKVPYNLHQYIPCNLDIT